MSTVPSLNTIHEHVRRWGNGWRLLGYAVAAGDDPSNVYGYVRVSYAGGASIHIDERSSLRVARMLAVRGPDALNDDRGPICYYALDYRDARSIPTGSLNDPITTTHWLAKVGGKRRRTHLGGMKLVRLGLERCQQNVRRPRPRPFLTCTFPAWERFCARARNVRNAAAVGAGPARVAGRLAA